MPDVDQINKIKMSIENRLANQPDWFGFLSSFLNGVENQKFKPRAKVTGKSNDLET